MIATFLFVLSVVFIWLLFKGSTQEIMARGWGSQLRRYHSRCRSCQDRLAKRNFRVGTDRRHWLLLGGQSNISLNCLGNRLHLHHRAIRIVNSGFVNVHPPTASDLC
jgi:hypothetical protein